MLMFRPFPADLIGRVIQGKKGVVVLERLDQPLAVDLPLMREIRATVSRCIENGQDPKHPAYPELATYRSFNDAPALYSGSFGMGSRDLQPEGIVGAVENMLDGGPKKKLFYLSIDFLRDKAITPKQEMYQQTIEETYPDVRELAVRGSENPNLMPEGSITVRFHSIGGWGAITTGKNLAMTLFDLLGLSHQGQPQVRIGEEGPADDLLPVGGAGTDPDQLRILLRRRRAVAGPERLRAHQRLGRAQRGRRLHHPERQGYARSALGEHSAPVPEDHHRPEDQACSTWTRSRSPVTRRPTPISSSECRESRSKARSSPHRR